MTSGARRLTVEPSDSVTRTKASHNSDDSGDHFTDDSTDDSTDDANSNANNNANGSHDNCNDHDPDNDDHDSSARHRQGQYPGHSSPRQSAACDRHAATTGLHHPRRARRAE